MDPNVVRERREQIEADAACEGCRSTLASCKANRGKDPTAPPWFGCCAQGTDFRPCVHRPNTNALLDLLREIEHGVVKSTDDNLLDWLVDLPRMRRFSRPMNHLYDDDGWV